MIKIGLGYVVQGDLYNISQRIKEIDSSYFLYFNYKNRKYELHSKNQVKNSYVLTLPFSSLDNRTITHILKTRVERKKEFLKEIEKENEKLQKRELDKILKRAEKLL